MPDRHWICSECVGSKVVFIVPSSIFRQLTTVEATTSFESPSHKTPWILCPNRLQANNNNIMNYEQNQKDSGTMVWGPGSTHLRTMEWCVLSGSPLGLADVMARGPVRSHRCPVTVWSGTRIMMLSAVPTRSYAAPTPMQDQWELKSILKPSFKSSLPPLQSYQQLKSYPVCRASRLCSRCSWCLRDRRSSWTPTAEGWRVVRLRAAVPRWKCKYRWAFLRVYPETQRTQSTHLVRSPIAFLKIIFHQSRDFAYFDVVDLLDCLGILTGGSQGIDCVGGNTTYATFVQEFSYLQEATGEPGFSHRARELRFILLFFLILKSLEICG